jgi:hypothetical protein
MLGSIELKKRENRDDLDFLTNGRLRNLWYKNNNFLLSNRGPTRGEVITVIHI